MSLATEFTLKDGVFIPKTALPSSEFEPLYIAVRKKENRVYSHEEIISLPYPENDVHRIEWKMRAKSFERVRSYLIKKNEQIRIMDLGAGNGWFALQMANSVKHKFTCVDVNFTELRQAAHINSHKNIDFYFCDIFKNNLPEMNFDIIILNSVIQYFPDLRALIKRLKEFLNYTGEIHLIDSPIYSRNEIAMAKQNTIEYYKSIGFERMAENYFHHSFEELSTFNYKFLYKPIEPVFRLLSKLSGFNYSPFPWVLINP